MIQYPPQFEYFVGGLFKAVADQNDTSDMKADPVYSKSQYSIAFEKVNQKILKRNTAFPTSAKGKRKI